MHALLDELSTRGPVALVVEDAHWADASTRDLVSFLLSRRFAGRCLVLVTFRSDEMHRRHPLRQRVAEWVRVAGVERVQLEPLPASAVRTMVSHLVDSDEALGGRHDDDVSRIVQRAQGNAFYVEELVSAFLGGGWSLPEDLADLLLVRLERLDEQSRGLVRVASAAGQRVSHDLLARVAGMDETELELALRAAIDAHVLVRTGESAYAFRHALLGEAVYDDLLPGERMRLHTAYAEAVRELLGSRGAADLARHALASHDLPTALIASVEAGDLAMANGGPDEAAGHFTKALEIYPRAARELAEPPDEAELVARTVDALCAAGRPETAMALVDSQLERLPADAPDLTRARLLARPGGGDAGDRGRAAAQRGHHRGAGPGRPGAHGPARPDPRAARPGDDLGRPVRRRACRGRRGDRAGRAARPAAALRRREPHPDLAQPAPRLRRGQPGRAQADHRGRPPSAATGSARCAATCAPAASSSSTATSPAARRPS